MEPGKVFIATAETGTGTINLSNLIALIIVGILFYIILANTSVKRTGNVAAMIRDSKSTLSSSKGTLIPNNIYNQASSLNGSTIGGRCA